MKLVILRKILNLSVLKIGYCILLMIGINSLFGDDYRGLSSYPYLSEREIEQNLYYKVHASIQQTKNKCIYDMIYSKKKWQTQEFLDDESNTSLDNVSDGMFSPRNCTPSFSVAVLITFRNRQSQLDVLLPYLHKFLQRQNLHYKVYVIEQQDENLWNKGLLYNVGARAAIDDGYPCLVTHDVDLLPLSEANIYACTLMPRHMSAVIDKFRFVLPYVSLVGGVLAITADQYVQVNGYTNKIFGWGSEDDDLWRRIHASNLSVWRFPPHMSVYSMIRHVPQIKNLENIRKFKRIGGQHLEDGLNTVHYHFLKRTEKVLYTHLGVKISRRKSRRKVL